MSFNSLPFAEINFIEIHGRSMAYIDEGEGAPSPSSTEIPPRLICGGISCLLLEGMDASSPATLLEREIPGSCNSGPNS